MPVPRRAAPLVCALCLPGLPAQALDIQGKVVDNFGKPAPYARLVRVGDSSAAAFADDSGDFTYRDAPARLRGVAKAIRPAGDHGLSRDAAGRHRQAEPVFNWVACTPLNGGGIGAALPKRAGLDSLRVGKEGFADTVYHPARETERDVSIVLRRLCPEGFQGRFDYPDFVFEVQGPLGGEAFRVGDTLTVKVRIVQDIYLDALVLYLGIGGKRVAMNTAGPVVPDSATGMAEFRYAIPPNATTPQGAMIPTVTDTAYVEAQGYAVHDYDRSCYFRILPAR